MTSPRFPLNQWALAALLALCAALAAAGPAAAAVTTTFSGGTFTASSDAGDPISVGCDRNSVRVNGADVQPRVICDFVEEVVVDGGPGANVIDLRGVTERFNTGRPAVTITGGGGDDTIQGSAHADVIDPGPGRDTATGNEGDDSFQVTAGDGSDSLTGSTGADEVVYKGAAAAESYVLRRNTAFSPEHVLERTSPGLLAVTLNTVERLSVRLSGGDDVLDAVDLVLSTPLTTSIDGGEGSDRLQGPNSTDTITGGPGADFIDAGAGADTVQARDGEVDQIACGAAADSAIVDLGDGVADTCETVDRPAPPAPPAPPVPPVAPPAPPAAPNPPATTPSPPATPRDRTAPRVRLVGTKVAVKRGVARLKVACPRAETRGCDVGVALRVGKLRAGHGKARVPGGATRVVTVRVSALARKLLAKRPSLRATAIVTASDRAGNRATGRTPLVLRSTNR